MMHIARAHCCYGEYYYRKPTDYKQYTQIIVMKDENITVHTPPEKSWIFF